MGVDFNLAVAVEGEVYDDAVTLEDDDDWIGWSIFHGVIPFLVRLIYYVGIRQC